VATEDQSASLNTAGVKSVTSHVLKEGCLAPASLCAACTASRLHVDPCACDQGEDGDSLDLCSVVCSMYSDIHHIHAGIYSAVNVTVNTADHTAFRACHVVS
jgi:hypothetical protein